MSLTDKNNYIPNGWTRLPNGKLVKGDASEDKMVTSYKRILNKSDEQFKSIKIVQHKPELTDKDYKIGDVIPIKIDNQELSAKWCETYKNETIGGIGIVIDSWGMASLFLSNGNAQKLLNCKDNSKVIIKVSN